MKDERDEAGEGQQGGEVDMRELKEEIERNLTLLAKQVQRMGVVEPEIERPFR